MAAILDFLHTAMSKVLSEYITISPGAQGSKLSTTGPKGLKVVSNWKFCAESENQRLTCRTWEVFQIRGHCCHGDRLRNSKKNAHDGESSISI